MDRGWPLPLTLTSHPLTSANSPRSDEVVLQDVPLAAYSFSISADHKIICQIIIGLSVIICDMTEWDQGGRSYRLAVGDHNGVIYELRSLNNLLGSQSPLKHRGPVSAQMDPNAISSKAQPHPGPAWRGVGKWGCLAGGSQALVVRIREWASESTAREAASLSNSAPLVTTGGGRDLNTVSDSPSGEPPGGSVVKTLCA